MATEPYNPIPDVAPEARPPDDYQNVQANPSSFGGLIAQGVEKFGEGASKAGLFFGEVQTDDAVNGAMTSANKSLNDFLAKNGRDALDAQGPTQKAIDDAFASGRAGLSTPQQQYQYDQTIRTFQQRYLSGKMATHADEQAKAYGQTVNADSLKLALDGVTNTADDPAQVEAWKDKARQAAFRSVHLAGNENDPVAVKAAIQSADMAVYKTQAEVIAVKDPVRALALVEEHKADLGPYYHELANQFRARADQQQGTSAGQTALTGAAAKVGATTPPGVTDPKFVRYNGFLGSGDVQSALRLSEGLRTNAYMDESPGHPELNHWAIGYGMHQIVRPDGTTEEVTAFTKITPEEAERNLGIQAAKAAQTAQTAIGPAWSSMAPGAKAALTSVVYNYGHVPNDIATAAQGDDANALASAIASHAHDNAGVNSQRRLAEAGAVLGKFGLSGPEATTTPQPTMTMPAAGTDQSVATPPSASTAAPVAPTLDTQPPAPPQPIHERTKAEAFSQIDEQERTGALNPAAAQHARAYVNQQIAAQQIAEAEDAKAKKEKSDKALDDYVTRYLNGDNTAALYNQVANDHNLLPEVRLNFGKAIEKTADVGVEQAAKTYGPGFWDAYKKVAAPSGDPDRIADASELLKRAGPGGDLTLAGVDKLMSEMQKNQRSVNDQAVSTAKMGLLHYAQGKLSFEQDIGPIKIRDPKGEAIFNAQFIPKFEAAYDAMLKKTDDPWAFLTKDNVDKMLEGMRPKAEMDQARVLATGEAVGQSPLTPQQPAPPPPAGVDPTGWTAVISQPPLTATGTPWPMTNWGAAINALRADPAPAKIKAFDEWFGPSGYSAEAILGRLVRKTTTTPNREVAPAQDLFGEPPEAPSQHPQAAAPQTFGMPPLELR